MKPRSLSMPVEPDDPERLAGPVGTPPLAHPRRRRPTSERGAGLVEMALVLPVLIMLLVGTITAGIAYGQRNSLQNAAREASRYAATLPGPVTTAWLQTVRDVTRAAATGHLEATAPGQFICVAYVSGGSASRLTDEGGVESTGNVPCFDDGRPGDEARVQVVTSRIARIDGALFRWDVTIRSEAAARYERAE